MYNIYKSFIVISKSVKLADISVHYKQMHKFTSLPIQCNLLNARTVSTTRRFDTLENTNSIKLRCKTPRQTNTPVHPRQHSKSD